MERDSCGTEFDCCARSAYRVPRMVKRECECDELLARNFFSMRSRPTHFGVIPHIAHSPLLVNCGIPLSPAWSSTIAPLTLEPMNADVNAAARSSEVSTFPRPHCDELILAVSTRVAAAAVRDAGAVLCRFLGRRSHARHSMHACLSRASSLGNPCQPIVADRVGW